MCRLLILTLLACAALVKGQCPQDLCEEDTKVPICLMDADENYNRICAYVDDLPSYFARGGFDPSFRDGFDCECNLLFAPTEAPTTAAPTESPTDSPTDAPTEAPTSAPTDAPTEPPTDALTGVIGDSVFIDENGNGVQDIGEPGLYGVQIYLLEDTTGNGVYDSTTSVPVIVDGDEAFDISSLTGNYAFERLDGGNYIIVITDPDDVTDGMVPTFSIDPPNADVITDYGTGAGPNGEDITVVGVVPITIGDDEQNTNEDFGFEPEPEEVPEICMDTVPDEPSRNFRCLMDSNYNVDMAIVDLTDTFTLDWYYDYFPLGSYVDQFNIGLPVYWDCWCHAQCPWGNEHDHMFVPEFLVRDSWFYDNILHLTVAIPNSFDMGTMFYFQDIFGNAIPVGECDTTNIAGCTYWTEATTQEYFRHNCYTAYYTDIPLDMLTPYYGEHVTGSEADNEAWMITYYGLLVSQSTRDMGLDVRDVAQEFIQRSTYKWQLTFPVQVDAHVEDIRVYDEVNKVDAVIAAEVHIDDFEWGFSWGMYNFWGEVVIRTSVQWPFMLDIVDAVYRPNDGNIVVFLTSVNNDGCADPGITEYGDVDFVLSATANQLTGGEFIPVECVQIYEFRLEAGNELVCDFDGYYDLSFDVVCQPSYAANCPLDERYDEPLRCEFWLTTENFCDEFSDEVTVTADMDSFECPERVCACAQDDFIETFVNQNGDIAEETVYFELSVMSTEPLDATELRSLHADVICDEPPVNVMTEIYNRFWELNNGWDIDLTGAVDNTPIAILQCSGGDPGNTINFEFNLPPDFFNVPLDDSCHLSVWATVDLWYRGVSRPDGLLQGQGKKKLLETVEYEERNVLAFGENPQIVLSTSLQLSDGQTGVEVQEVVADRSVVDDVPLVDEAQKGSASRFAPFVWSLLLAAAYML